MTNFPKGGDVEATRVWLDNKGFINLFQGWKANDIIGKSDQFLKTNFPETFEGNEQAEKLCGFMSTARKSAGFYADNIVIVDILILLTISIF
jgi:hypothetical protein